MRNPSNVIQKWNRWKKNRATRKYREHLQQEAERPRRAVPSNRRALTLPRERTGSGSSNKELHYRRMKLLLWCKTTFDVRQLIYEEVLGKQCVHIVRSAAESRFSYVTQEAPRTTVETRVGVGRTSMLLSK